MPIVELPGKLCEGGEARAVDKQRSKSGLESRNAHEGRSHQGQVESSTGKLGDNLKWGVFLPTFLPLNSKLFIWQNQLPGNN